MQHFATFQLTASSRGPSATAGLLVFKRNDGKGNFLAVSAPAFSTVVKWHAEFERGCSSCDDLPRCGRPATCVDLETVEKVNKLVMSDRRLSVRFIAVSVGISTGSMHSILTENLSMNRMSARWVPRVSSDAQKADRVEASTGLLRLFNKNPTTLFHDS